MREYVITLIVTASVCTLASALTPDTERGLSGYTKLVAGLCILCVAISPISSFIERIYSAELNTDFSYIGGLDSYELEGIYKASLDNASVSEISERLEGMICSSIGVNEEDIEVFLELYERESNKGISKVTVVLSGKAMLVDPREITDYVYELLGCECEVAYR